MLIQGESERKKERKRAKKREEGAEKYAGEVNFSTSEDRTLLDFTDYLRQ